MSDRGDASTPGEVLGSVEERLRRLERLVHDHHHEHGNLLGLADDDHGLYLLDSDIKTAQAPTTEICAGCYVEEGGFWRGGPFPSGSEIVAVGNVVDDPPDANGLHTLRMARFDLDGFTLGIINDDSVARSGTMVAIGLRIR